MNTFMDLLEQRRLYSATLTGGRLRVAGDAGNNDIVVGLDLDHNQVVSSVDGVVRRFDATQVQRIAIFAGDGKDNVTFDYAFHLPVTVHGGAGDDQITATFLTHLRVYGGGGADLIVTQGPGRDTIYGDAGGSTDDGGSIGPDGNDTIKSSGGRDYLSGDGGDDNINGGNGPDRIFGGDGNDTLAGSSSHPGDDASDTIDGGAGNDVIAGWGGDDSLSGGDGNDYLAGRFGNDTLDGGAGDDLVVGGPGTDSMTGGAGADQFDKHVTENDVVTDLQDGVDQLI